MLALAVLLAVAAPTLTVAEKANDAAAGDTAISRGAAIAQARCAVCHAVGAGDESPTWVNSNTPFRALSERFPIPMLQEAARTGLVSGHDEMPGFQFSMDEIGDLLAYIDSLAPQQKRYLQSAPPR